MGNKNGSVGSTVSTRYAGPGYPHNDNNLGHAAVEGVVIGAMINRANRRNNPNPAAPQPYPPGYYQQPGLPPPAQPGVPPPNGIPPPVCYSNDPQPPPPAASDRK